MEKLYLSLFCTLLCLLCSLSDSWSQAAPAVYLLKPSRVFDGETMHSGWVVLVRKDRIAGAGPAAGVKVPSEAKRIDLTGTTLMPGLIEAHSHVLLHPYNDVSWNDQNA